MKKQLFLWALLLSCTMPIFAHDFEVDGIYYNFLGGDSVEVTFRGNSYNDYNNEYSGSVTIPETVKYNNTNYYVTAIGDYAFHNTGVTSIFLPNNLVSIREGACDNCPNLTKNVYDNAVYLGTIDNPYYALLWANGGDITTCTIHNQTKIIGDWAFFGRANLTSINIPSGVHSIGVMAFYECSKLTDITLPNSVTLIDDIAFGFCTELSSITLPNNLTSIEDNLFQGCTKLSSITFPNTLKTIGVNAFLDCESLHSVIIPNQVSIIGSGAFSYCTHLTSITLPRDLTTISSGAFRNCHGLSTITIPSNVQSIGERAFYNCDNLSFIYIEAITPPTWTSASSYNNAYNQFTNIAANAVFTVPCEAVSSYKTATHWKDLNIANPAYYTIDVVSGNTQYGIVKIHQYPTCETNNSAIIEAIANEHYQFSSWNDGNKDNPRTVTVTEDVTYIANFEPIMYTITAASEDVTKGSVTGTGSYHSGTSATLTAIANEHYQFAAWSDGNTDNPRTVTVSGNKTYTATFKPIMYTISTAVNNTAWGIVKGAGEYHSGTSATLTAEPNAHCRFKEWSDGNTDNPRTITIIEDKTYTAVFEPIMYTVTANSNNAEWGIVIGAGKYQESTVVTLTATASEHYQFSSWNDGNTQNPRTIIATEDVTYTATFEPIMYTLTVKADDTQKGSVTGGGSYHSGTTATLTATANPHYAFAGWSDGNTDNPRTVTVSGDKTYTATFKPIMYTISTAVNNTAWGVVKGAGEYHSGTSATLTAEANIHYRFKEWNDGNKDNPRRIAITKDETYTATFEPIMCTIVTLANNTAWGTAEGSGEYQEGQIITLTATATQGYQFTQWNDGNTDNPRTLTVTDNAIYTATFEAVRVVSISLSQTSATISKGKTLQIEASVLPANALDKSVVWSSDNETVATVEDGLIYAHEKGIATIQAMTVDGNKIATCQVTVISSVTGIILDKSEVTLAPKGAVQLTATVLPEDANNKNFTWSSDDATIALVSNGMVVALNVGQTAINVTTEDGNFTASCIVHVEIPVSSIAINPSSLTLTPGNAEQLMVVILPEDATNKNYSWQSDNTTVATILDNGWVVANGLGTANIIATSESGNKTATCQVTVVENLPSGVDYQNAAQRDKVVKVLENGTIYILRNGEKYAVDGRKVE